MTVEAPIHPAAKAMIADGALAQLRTMHKDMAKLSAAAERGRPLSKRMARGVQRARRNGWRLHRYPGDYWRGLRGTGTPKRARVDIRTLQALTKGGRLDEAVAFAAALLPLKSKDSGFLNAALHTFGKAGALSLQLQAIAALRRRDDSPARQLHERKLIGRIRETDPSWLPHVPPDITVRTPAPRRILHVVKVAMPHRQSGYTVRSRYIIDSQRAAGLDPVVLTALGSGQQADLGDLPATELVDGTYHHHLESTTDEVLDGPVDLYLDAYAEQACRRAAEIAPSVIHVHSGHRGYDAGLVGLALARALGLPLVYEVRGFFESLWNRDLEWNERGETYERRLATETRCMVAADAVVTLSESMRAEIISRGVDAGKVFVAPNGVDVEAFHPKPRSARLVEDLGLEGKFVFGYVSNLDHHREGQESLIRAAVELRDRGISAVALIVGDGKRRDVLETLAAREGAGDSVIFTGRIPHDEVLDYYRLLDVFVVPRVPERAARLVTPLKPFEAMAAGVPVVVSELAALLEIIGDGARGRSFAPGDGHSLAEVLAELHKDVALRRELAERAREWVVEERQWSATAARYAAVYEAARSHQGTSD